MLNTNSPAIGNGVAANCEATDARGKTRGQQGCDSGAYEFGGGEGQLGAAGMSGVYFNAANNANYVSVQRLGGDFALVIWNTFDELGAPAWLYGVGTVSGSNIHVAQVAWKRWRCAASGRSRHRRRGNYVGHIRSRCTELSLGDIGLSVHASRVRLRHDRPAAARLRRRSGLLPVTIAYRVVQQTPATRRRLPMLHCGLSCESHKSHPYTRSRSS